jgi:hypothetical protein
MKNFFVLAKNLPKVVHPEKIRGKIFRVGKKFTKNDAPRKNPQIFFFHKKNCIHQNAAEIIIFIFPNIFFLFHETDNRRQNNFDCLEWPLF